MSNDAVVNKEAIETVKDLIKDIETAMLTTLTNEGLTSRPMQTQEVEFDGDLWFLTKKDTSKYQEIRNNPHVNVAYVGKSFVSIRGTAEFVNDNARKKEIWNLAYEKLLDTTYDDPNIVLIKVRAETAEYWETGNKTKTVIQMIKKIIGKSTASEGGTDINKTVDLE